MAIPIIAIVGRPNVGKSTLFNRLAGRRIAVVSDIAGTTRDRVSTDARWAGRRFILVDTAGIEGQSQDILWEEMRGQVEKALVDADALVFVMDTVEGLTSADIDAARLIRRYGKPVVLVANKADNYEREQLAVEGYELGLGAPIAISAYHGIGIEDLMNSVAETVPGEPEPEDLDATRVAIVGRPNVGKSALLNALTGEERAVVSTVPGTTRDPVDSRYSYEGRDLVFIDTAGLRRRGRTEPGIEKYSALRTIQAIERSHTVLVVMDASELATAQDAHIAGYARDAARGIVAVINKWDLARGLELNREEAAEQVRARFRFLPDSPVVFTSALRGTGLREVLQAATGVFEEWSKHVDGSVLRRTIVEAMAAHAPPTRGRRRVRLRSVVQTRSGPPTFTLRVTSPDLIHFSYRRYLENRLRAAFGFRGSPLRLHFVGRD